MQIFEILTEAGTTVAWKRTGHGVKSQTTTRKYRCTSGPRKGQVRASPASCNAPYKYKSAVTLKQTKAKLGGHGKFKTARTKKYNPATKRLKTLNPTRRKAR